MTRQILLAALLCATLADAPAQTTPAGQAQKHTKAPVNKYNDNVDDRMKGPHGEKIYIGEKGGRYYLKNGKKVYVPYKANKKPKKT